MSFRTHLRRDGDEPDRSLASLFVRQLGELATDMGRARRVATWSQYPGVAARLAAYHASFVGRPLALRETSSFAARVNGRRVRVTLRRNTSDLQVFRELFVQQALLGLVGDGLADARTVVDLGSNIGLSSLYLACWAERARFYCVDPAPENNLIARRNMEDNGIDATVETCAIADHDGEAEFFPNEWWASSSTLRSVIDSRTTSRRRFESSMTLPPTEVAACTVSTFLRRHGLTTVDVLKMDIEGAESSVIEHDASWLDAVETLAIEIHGKYVDPTPVTAALERHGMRRRGAGGPFDIFTRRPVAG